MQATELRPHLLLRLDDGAEPALQIRPAGGPASWQAVTPAQLRAQVGRAALSVLVPGVDVLLTRARLAPMGAHRLRRALPFVLEEELADEIERLHFTPGTANEDPLPVAVVASERLARWQALLESTGVRARSITPDVLALPWAPGAWSVLLAGDRAWVRSGRQSGFATDRATMAVCLDAALRDAADDRPVHAELYAASDDDAVLEVAARLQAAGVAITQHRERDQPLDWLGADLDSAETIDLLTGVHGAAVHAPPPRRAWLRSAVMLVALSVVHLGVVSVEYRHAQSRLAATQVRIAAIYHTIYPGEPLPERPHARIARDLAALGDGDAARRDRLLAVLAPAARRLGEAPGWELQRLDFRDGRLDVDLRVPDAAALDRVQRLLAGDATLSVERVSASATQGAAEARLRLRPTTGDAR